MIMQDRIVGSNTRRSIRIDIRNLRRRFFVCLFIWSCMIIYDIVARSYTIRQESVTDLNVWFSDLGKFAFYSRLLDVTTYESNWFDDGLCWWTNYQRQNYCESYFRWVLPCTVKYEKAKLLWKLCRQYKFVEFVTLII